MMQTENEKLLGIKEVLKIIPVTRATIYRLMNEGQFPANHRISRGRVCWKQSEVDQWISECWEEPRA